MTMIRLQAGNPVRRNASAVIGAALASALLCSSSLAQTQPAPNQPQAQPKQRQPAPAAATPTRPTAPAVAAPAAVAPAAPATAPSAARADSDIVARVAGRDVTTTEVRSFIAGLGAREQVALARDPAMLSQAVRLMLANQLVLKEAQTKKWHEQAAVAAQLERVREAAIVETYLQAVSTPPQTFPEDSEIEKAYEANKTAFVVPRQFRLAQIFVALPAGADKETEDKARKKLADLQAKLKQPKADFAALAKESSDQRETAGEGGDLGWVAENQVRPEIKTQVMGLANNAVSDPIKLDEGWHIIKLIDTKAATTRPLAEVRDLIAQQLRSQRAEAVRRAYLARVLEQSPPAINEIALAKVFNQPSDTTPSR